MYEKSITCPGIYGGHLQGIALDHNGSIYWSFTVELVKTDAQGNICAQVTVPSHHGDICYRDGIIYAAVNRGHFNRDEDLSENWVYAYNAEDLSFMWKRKLPEIFHGAGGINYRGDHFFVVGGLPEGYAENYVYEYNEDCEYICKHTLMSGYTFKGIQTACPAYERWWFGCYGTPNKLIVTDKAFNLLGSYEFECALGIAAPGDDTFLLGRNWGDHPNQGKVLMAHISSENSISLDL